MDGALALATPLILDPALSPEELQHEWELMLLRSQATEKFCRGEISQDDWEDILDFCGVDVIQADQDWSENLGYL